MTNGPLNRREFLRLSLLLTGSALATACQKTVTGSTPTAKQRSSLEAGVQLKTGKADSWTFRKSVKGGMENPAACQAVWIDSNGSRVQAT
jgi:hypothetical protein